jgi:Tfp pilus assembly ATPase PilU
MKLSENDAALYRLYAVGLLTYEEALKQAESESRLRRAMLQFDQTVRTTPNPVTVSRPPSTGSRPAST